MNTIALIGSDFLVGREICDIVAASPSTFDLRLIAGAGHQLGALTAVGDEPAVIADLNAVNLADAHAVLLAGSAESSSKAVKLLDDSGIPIIDLNGAVEERVDARLRAPFVEDPEDEPPAAAVHVIAHPAAIALALFIRRLHALEPVQSSVIEIFAPASEHGAPGVEELQSQTISLLSFKPLPRAVFDTQLSFSLLPRLGSDAPVRLEDAELRIERHLATLLALPGDGSDAPMPSLRLLQAPVFHGYSFSAWVEFENSPGIDTLEAGLPTGSIEVRSGDMEPPTNVGQAGQSGITIGAIQPDRNHPDACWFWIVADNLRITAENGIAVARQLV